VHGFRCYDNIDPNSKCKRVPVLALCLVIFVKIEAVGILNSSSGFTNVEAVFDANVESGHWLLWLLSSALFAV